jgi:hypothetical protein
MLQCVQKREGERVDCLVGGKGFTILLQVIHPLVRLLWGVEWKSLESGRIDNVVDCLMGGQKWGIGNERIARASICKSAI